jgi:MGT family glycosyltransferase
MTHSFLLATWEGGGSVAPVLTVARKLVDAGHRVRVMSDACNRPEAEAAEAEFRPWTRAPSRPDRSRESDLLRDWDAPTPVEGLMKSIDVLWAGPALAQARDLIEELEREPADLVVANEMLFGVPAACEALAQPYAILSVNVSLLPLPGVPPMGPGLPPAQTDEDRAMHAAIAEQMIGLLDHGLPAVNAARAELGLAPLAHLIDQSRDAPLLLATSRAFDFPSDALPANVRYVGPQLGEPSWADDWRPAAKDARPMVLVGFSTTFQNHTGVVQRVIDALGELPVRGVVTLGDSLAEDELTAPGNVELVRHARHDALMREAAVVVTHGGHGTVCRALAHGLPMLVVPHGRDQNDNAVRVSHRGAGLTLMPDASTEAIGAALRRLLHEPSFTEAAARLGSAVAAETAQSAVVAELEALAGMNATSAAA